MQKILNLILLLFLVLTSYLFKQEYLIFSERFITQTVERSNDLAKVKANISQSNHKLIINYSVQNLTDSNIELIHTLPLDWEGNFADHFAYVIVNNSTVTLLVGSGGLRAARGQIIPLLFVVPGGNRSQLAKGDTFSDSIAMDLPLRENQVVYPAGAQLEYYKQKVNNLLFKVQMDKSPGIGFTEIELPFTANLVVDTTR